MFRQKHSESKTIVHHESRTVVDVKSIDEETTIPTSKASTAAPRQKLIQMLKEYENLLAAEIPTTSTSTVPPLRVYHLKIETESDNA